ncbi:protein eyes shut-like [Cherax quadricarinatus]|uniref:protein eyes shut-like n=1 Tax=Cherax quadricarinatus TaxID=27406 RepID=UPI00387E7A26
MLLLRNSLLQFVFSCGLQTVSFLQGNDKLSRNYQTDVSVRMWWTPYRLDAPWGPGMCSASMQVNGTAPIYSEQRSSSPRVILGLLYLGGLPSSYSSPMVVKAGFLPRLKGCVSLLEVNGREVDAWVSSVSGERVEECGSSLCPAGSCYNGGSCVPGPALWSCRCPPGYQGELCEQHQCTGGRGGVGGPCQSGLCIPTHHSHPLCLCPTHRHGLYCELERVVERPSYFGTVEGYSSYSAYRLYFDVAHTVALRSVQHSY